MLIDFLSFIEKKNMLASPLSLCIAPIWTAFLFLHMGFQIEFHQPLVVPDHKDKFCISAGFCSCWLCLVVVKQFFLVLLHEPQVTGLRGVLKLLYYGNC